MINLQSGQLSRFSPETPSEQDSSIPVLNGYALLADSAAFFQFSALHRHGGGLVSASERRGRLEAALSLQRSWTHVQNADLIFCS